jgi:hypothetical protein
MSNPDNLKRTAAKSPLESFGPEILAALVKASKEEITIELPSVREAWRFQQRIHQLRKRMRDSSHEQYPLAARVKVQILWGEKAGYEKVEEKMNSKGLWLPVDTSVRAKVRLSPRDQEFRDALNAAGVKLEDLKDAEQILDNIIPKGPDHSAIEDIMGDLDGKKS